MNQYKIIKSITPLFNLVGKIYGIKKEPLIPLYNNSIQNTGNHNINNYTNNQTSNYTNNQANNYMIEDVIIDNGVLKQGQVNKGVSDSILHMIFNEYGYN